MTTQEKRAETRKKRKPPKTAYWAVIEDGDTKQDWLKVARGVK